VVAEEGAGARRTGQLATLWRIGATPGAIPHAKAQGPRLASAGVMRTNLRTKAVLFTLLAALGLSQLNCGIILHPERNGRKGTRVDVVTVVFDCLWLIVGVVPGVVALIIDIVTGGLYEASLHNLFPGDPLGLRFHGAAPATADVAILLSAPDGTVQTLASRHVEKGEHMDEAPVRLPETLTPGTYAISIAVNGHENARFPLQIR
jgi:hypothetical protein